MTRFGDENADYKSELISEIYSISIQHVKCGHRLTNNLIKSPFIDWYLLLRVEEDADIQIIRKQYHKLALQLHPDKNKHPKAEFAFKLVSEAYTCLSDKSKRKYFNSERQGSFCIKCKSIPYITSNHPSAKNSVAEKLKGLNPINRARSSKISKVLKGIKDRFKEEARVVETCLKANAGHKHESPVFKPSDNNFGDFRQMNRKDSPVFNPSHHAFEGYPHTRTRVYKKPENLRYLQTGNVLNCGHERIKYESPVFETSPVRLSLRNRTSSVYV